MGLDAEALRGIKVTHNFNFCLLCWDAGNTWASSQIIKKYITVVQKQIKQVATIEKEPQSHSWLLLFLDCDLIHLQLQ